MTWLLYPEYLTALVIHNKVYISLPVSLFNILQTMEFFRESADRFTKHLDFINPDRHFPNFGPEYVARHADNVPAVEETVDEFELFLPEVAFPDI